VPPDVLTQIRELLAAARVEYREVHHEPTRTSEESARARDEDLSVGGKALVLKVDKTFRLFVLSAARKLDSAAIKRHFAAKKLRFATAAELEEMTGLTQGAVPPFGQPVLPFELFVDSSILANDTIAFNAGSLATSIVMAVKDYMAAARPQIFRFGT
jgi:Ala-tRNA(Pro) deacylase